MTDVVEGVAKLLGQQAVVRDGDLPTVGEGEGQRSLFPVGEAIIGQVGPGEDGALFHDAADGGQFVGCQGYGGIAVVTVFRMVVASECGAVGGDGRVHLGKAAVGAVLPEMDRSEIGGVGLGDGGALEQLAEQGRDFCAGFVSQYRGLVIGHADGLAGGIPNVDFAAVILPQAVGGGVEAVVLCQVAVPNQRHEGREGVFLYNADDTLLFIAIAEGFSRLQKQERPLPRPSREGGDVAQGMAVAMEGGGGGKEGHIPGKDGFGGGGVQRGVGAAADAGLGLAQDDDAAFVVIVPVVTYG